MISTYGKELSRNSLRMEIGYDYCFIGISFDAIYLGQSGHPIQRKGNAAQGYGERPVDEDIQAY